MRKRIRVVVVDDEALGRRRLQRFLKAEPDVEVVGAFGGGRQAVAALKRLAPDVVFLDVQMPETGGFEVLSALDQEALPKVVFVTAFSEHAVRAFEVGAVDYLLKPFDAPRFAVAFARVRVELQREPDEYAKRLVSWIEKVVRREKGVTAREHRSAGWLERFMVKDRGRVYFLRASEIDWIEAADNYVRIHTGKAIHLIRQTLSSFEAELDPTRFARIHRGAIVNLDRVKEIQQGVGHDHVIILETGARLKLSDRYRRQLQ